MGSEHHYPDEGPVRQERVDGFWIDSIPVTNEMFGQFVADTGYLTVAEISPPLEAYPEVHPEDLVPGSLVFTMTAGPVDLSDFHQWWSWIRGADWKHPTGPDSSLEGMDLHPAVHIAYEDARAYAVWAGKELPSEVEWEYAARGGLIAAEFTWGTGDPQNTAEPKANTWHGRFPYETTDPHGWARTSPVGLYEPNGFGLYDMAGNVWEWTSGGYLRKSPVTHTCCGPMPPPPPADGDDQNPPPIRIPHKVIKGGSHLCTTDYCFRYRPAARQPQAIDSSTSHLGFRCVTRAPK